MLNYQLKFAEKIKCLNDISYALSLNPTWLKYGEKPKYILPDDRAPFRLIPYLDWPNLIDEYFLSMINRKAKSPYSDLVVSSTTPSHCFALQLNEANSENCCVLIFDRLRKANVNDFVLMQGARGESIVRELTQTEEGLIVNTYSDQPDLELTDNLQIVGVLIETRRAMC